MVQSGLHQGQKRRGDGRYCDQQPKTCWSRRTVAVRSVRKKKQPGKKKNSFKASQEALEEKFLLYIFLNSFLSFCFFLV